MKNLPKNRGQQSKPQSPWIKICLYAGLGLLILGLGLYGIMYMSLDREFSHNEKFFGKETYGEIFSLEYQKDEFEPLLKLAEEAFSFVGTEDEAEERFGLLSRYSITEADAATEKHTLDHISSGTEGDSGYVWIAYTQEVYKENGELLTAGGTQKQRVLSRWTVEKQNGTWIVTEIQEGP